jgi:hypothetical protein
MPEPAVSEVTPPLVTVTAPVVVFTEIPVPAATEFTLAFVLTGAVVWVVASLNTTCVLFIDTGMVCSFYPAVNVTALNTPDEFSVATFAPLY